MYSIPVARFGRHKPLITQQHECQQLPQSARYLQGLRAAPGSGPWCRSCTSRGSTTFMQAVGSGRALDLWAAIKSPRGRLAAWEVVRSRTRGPSPSCQSSACAVVSSCWTSTTVLETNPVTHTLCPHSKQTLVLGQLRKALI